MTTPCTGAISLLDVRTELGKTGTITMNDADVRELASKSSGAISMDDLRCKTKPIWLNIDNPMVSGTGEYSNMTESNYFDQPNFYGANTSDLYKVFDASSSTYQIGLHTNSPQTPICGAGRKVLCSANCVIKQYTFKIDVKFFNTGVAVSNYVVHKLAIAVSPYNNFTLTPAGVAGGGATKIANWSWTSSTTTVGASSSITYNFSETLDISDYLAGTSGNTIYLSYAYECNPSSGIINTGLYPFNSDFKVTGGAGT